MNKKHLFSLSLALIIVLLFSALGPTAVYADDGVPTDPTAVEASGTNDGATAEVVTEAQTDGTGEVQADAATEEGVTEPPADGTGELPAEDAVVEEPSLMEQVPDNTEVVVVNPEGEAEPLATQDAAEAVAASDPIWCPEGVGPGGAGCTASYNSFDDLLTFLNEREDANDAAYLKPGTIFVEMGDYGGGESSIDFNSYGFTSFDDNDLTIQGGWNTSDNTTTATTTFDIPIVIGSEANPWGGWITIRNINISGVVNDVGLTVYTAAGVIVEDSEFINNDAAGVFIDAGGDVDVRRSKINDNGSNAQEIVDGKGLEIKSGGYVTLKNVTANDNQIFGADVESVDGVSIVDSTFNGNLMYTLPEIDFLGYGLTVVSQGDISLSFCDRDNPPADGCTGEIIGVHADDNFLWGASLTGPNVFIENSTFNRNITDSTSFIDDTGLLIVSNGDPSQGDGAVALDFVEAIENRMMGADIQANGQVDIANSSFSRNYGVTEDATGNDVFWGCGLQVGGLQQTSGLRECGQQNLPASGINLLSVEANNNYFFGANLFAGSDVNISGSSFSNILYDDGTPDGFPQEQGEGLKVQSGGVVSLNTVTANNNRQFGADIVADSADGFITIDDSVFSNNLNGFGLSAESSGEFIGLTNVTALGNGGDGLHLVTAGDIFLNNVSALNNGGNGAFAQARCVVLNGGTFTGNGQYGLNAPNGLVNVSGTQTFTGNGVGPTNPNPFNPCPTPAPLPDKSAATTLYTVTVQTQDQLPGALGQGNAFGSALKVSLTSQGQATANLAITLSFPIPAGMEGANLVVMFWDGSQWVAVPGGSMVGSEFVITVTQPGIYVLVSQ